MITHSIAYTKNSHTSAVDTDVYIVLDTRGRKQSPLFMHFMNWFTNNSLLLKLQPCKVFFDANCKFFDFFRPSSKLNTVYCPLRRQKTVHLIELHQFAQIAPFPIPEFIEEKRFAASSDRVSSSQELNRR